MFRDVQPLEFVSTALHLPRTTHRRLDQQIKPFQFSENVQQRTCKDLHD
jgi:hypothetical protein